MTVKELHGQLPSLRNQCFDVTLAGLSNSFSGLYRGLHKGLL